MATWGKPWGTLALWGAPAGPGPNRYCDLADERVLAQMDDSPGTRNFRDFICELVRDFGTFEDVAFDVRDGFDLDVAQGLQLDKIGAVVGLPRQGFDDNRYRTFLQIQVDLLLAASRDDANWTGTHENIISIVRTFIGAGAPGTVLLLNFSPYSFVLAVPGLSLAELDILIAFICKAIYAGVLGQVEVLLATLSLWGSAGVGVTGAGTWGSASVVVVPSSTWNMVVTVGDQPCE